MMCMTSLQLECRPMTLAGLLKLKAEYPDARLVVGNTEVGIEMKFKDARYPVLIGVTHIQSSITWRYAEHALVCLQMPHSKERYNTLLVSKANNFFWINCGTA